MTMAVRPNVLLVAFDSLGTKMMENLAVKLPTLSALHASSVVFSSACVCSP